MTRVETLAGALMAAAQRIRGAAGWRRWLIAFLAGAGAALAMAPFYLLPLLAAGLTVFVLLIDGAKASARPLRAAFSAGWFWGFGYFLAGVYWMALSFFVQADQYAWMAPFAMTGMPAFLALFTGAAGAIAALAWTGGWPRIFLFAGVFALIEYARGHVLTGLPWNLAGQALAGTAAGAQSAAIYGAYGLSLVAVFLAAAPAAGLDGRARIRSGLFVMIAGAALLYGFGWLRLNAYEPHGDARVIVRIVQPNIPQREKIDWNLWARNFERQLDHSRGAAPPDAQLVVIWPENAAPLIEEAVDALDLLSSELPPRSVLLAGTVRRARDEAGRERWYNTLAVIDDDGAGARIVAANYDKHHLVPVGEYLPFYDLLNAIGLAALTPYQDSGFTAGSGPAVFSAAGTRFSPMICYEAIFPGASYPKGERPQWLVAVTNDAWFGDSSGPRQHLDMARLRSIESGLPMARSANTGVSALIDAKGRILARKALYTAGKIEAPLPPPLPPTPYARFGDWLFVGLSFLCLVVGRRSAATGA